MPRFLPIPDPGGSLQPPRRPPPTALATATPEPDPAPRPMIYGLMAYLVAYDRHAAPLHRTEEFGLRQPLVRSGAGVSPRPSQHPRREPVRWAERLGRIARALMSPAWY